MSRFSLSMMLPLSVSPNRESPSKARVHPSVRLLIIVTHHHWPPRCLIEPLILTVESIFLDCYLTMSSLVNEGQGQELGKGRRRGDALLPRRQEALSKFSYNLFLFSALTGFLEISIGEWGCSLRCGSNHSGYGAVQGCRTCWRWMIDDNPSEPGNTVH